MARSRSERKARQKAKRDQRDDKSGGAAIITVEARQGAATAAEASEEEGPPATVDDFSRISELYEDGELGPTFCQGFKVKNGQITKVPCGMELKLPEDIERRYCGHHKGQAPMPDIPSATTEEEAVSQPEATDSPMAEVDVVLDDGFDWRVIEGLGLPQVDPNEETREEAIVGLQPGALPPLRREVYLRNADGDPIDRYLVDPTPDGIETHGRNKVYLGVLANDKPVRMPETDYYRVLKHRTRKNETKPQNHRSLSYEVLLYFKARIAKAGYPASSDGALTRAAHAILHRELTWEELLDEDARQETERKERQEREREELQQLTDQALQGGKKPPAESAAATNGSSTDEEGSLDARLIGQIQEFAESLVDDIPVEEISYGRIVDLVTDKFDQADIRTITRALLGLVDAFKEAGIPTDL